MQRWKLRSRTGSEFSSYVREELSEVVLSSSMWIECGRGGRIQRQVPTIGRGALGAVTAVDLLEFLGGTDHWKNFHWNLTASVH